MSLTSAYGKVANRSQVSALMGTGSTYIVITSIMPPRNAVATFAKQSDCRLVVIGDKKLQIIGTYQAWNSSLHLSKIVWTSVLLNICRGIIIREKIWVTCMQFDRAQP